MEEPAQTDRRLRLMNSVATSLMRGEAQQVQLTGAFEAIAQHLGARHYLHYATHDTDIGQLILAGERGLDPTQLDGFRTRRVGERPCGLVAQIRAPVVLDTAQLAADAAAEEIRALGATAYAGLPLLAHGRLFGTVAFLSVTQPHFAAADILLLEMLAGQCAAALDRARLEQQLRASETRYRGAVITGRIAAWETNMVTRTRTWTDEGMALFGLDLPNGRGQVGGDGDEFWRTLHPDDKHMMARFHRTADREDSYPAEYRIVRPDGKVLWVSGRGRVVARGPDGKAQRVDNIVMDITDRKRAEDHIQLLMGEISHRSKNLLAVVQAIAGQTVRSAGSLNEFEERFASRLQGLSASHDLLVQENWRGAPLADLARQQLAPFAEAGSARLSMSGPSVVLTAGAAQTIGLALHELATNATKYGAWSRPAGKVAVDWRFGDDPATARHLRLSWVESGGPPVRLPTQRGFGHIVIANMVAQSVNGDVAMNFDAAGLNWALSIPDSNLVAA